MTFEAVFALSSALKKCRLLSLFCPSFVDSRSESVQRIFTETAVSWDSCKISTWTKRSKRDDTVLPAKDHPTSSHMTLVTPRTVQPLCLLRLRPQHLWTITLRPLPCQSGLTTFPGGLPLFWAEWSFTNRQFLVQIFKKFCVTPFCQTTRSTHFYPIKDYSKLSYSFNIYIVLRVPALIRTALKQKRNLNTAQKLRLFITALTMMFTYMESLEKKRTHSSLLTPNVL